MFCEKCGAKLEDGSLFCEQCGAKQESVASQPVQSEQAPVQENAQPAPMPELPKMSKKTMAIIAAVVAVVAIVLIAKALYVPTINLNLLIKPEFEGYDTVGEGQLKFDTNAFNDKYLAAVKKRGKNMSDGDGVAESFKWDIEDCYQSEFEGLKNGDTIELKWTDVDKAKLKEKYGCNIKYQDATFTVEGLKEVKSIDPFEKLKVEFTGIDGDGNAKYDTSDCDKEVKKLYFYSDKNYGLSNGDEVTYTIDVDNDYYAKKNGVVFSPTEKSYKVEGLSAYLDSKDQVSEDALTQMKSQAEDVIKAESAHWDSNREFTSAEYKGFYLLTSKNQKGYGDKNQIYLVYLVEDKYTPDEYNDAVERAYYYVIEYRDLLVNEAGEVTVDTSNYGKIYDNFKYDVKKGENHYDSYVYINGYATLDDFVTKKVTANAGDFNSQTTFEE